MMTIKTGRCRCKYFASDHSGVRPIGTRYTLAVQVDVSGTGMCSDHGHDVEWEVDGHVWVARFEGDGVGVLAEEVRCVSRRCLGGYWGGQRGGE